MSSPDHQTSKSIHHPTICRCGWSFCVSPSDPPGPLMLFTEGPLPLRPLSLNFSFDLCIEMYCLRFTLRNASLSSVFTILSHALHLLGSYNNLHEGVWPKYLHNGEKNQYGLFTVGCAFNAAFQQGILRHMECSIGCKSSKLCQICTNYGSMTDNSMNTQQNKTLSLWGDVHWKCLSNKLFCVIKCIVQGTESSNYGQVMPIMPLCKYLYEYAMPENNFFTIELVLETAFWHTRLLLQKGTLKSSRLHHSLYYRIWQFHETMRITQEVILSIDGRHLGTI